MTDPENTLEERTTIVGRPTYVAMFKGAQQPGPILDKLTGIGYPKDDISILLRPAGTDSAIDQRRGENAAGQDTDAEAAAAATPGAVTLVILHPEPEQVEAVRAALREMGAEERDYEPETEYHGGDD